MTIELDVSNPRFPFICPTVLRSPAGVPFLQSPGVVLIGRTETQLEGLRGFLEGFDGLFDADDYLDDDCEAGGERISDGALLTKAMGQLCYLSFGEGRTRGTQTGQYLENIKKQKHGSVTQHAQLSLVIFGVSRSFTHELVRHGVGTGYSQVSQRYVSGKTLRFVERPEFQGDARMHEMFIREIEHSSRIYDVAAEELHRVIDTAGMSKTEARKAVNQAAREFLPNAAEAPIGVTMNVRACRNILEQRGSEHADRPINRVAEIVCAIAAWIEPHLFSDYRVEPTKRGLVNITTPYTKI